MPYGRTKLEAGFICEAAPAKKPLQATSGTPSERLFGVRWLRRCSVSVTMLGLATLEIS